VTTPIYELGELVTIRKGKKAVEVSEGPSEGFLRYIQIEDLRNNDSMKYARNPKGPICDENDVLIAWDGAKAGTVGFGLSGLVGSTIAILKPNESVYAPYLGMILQSKYQMIRDACTGATIPHVSKPFLLRMKIPLPSISEQKRIAAILDKADEIRNHTEESDNIRNRFLSSLFLDIFGDATNEKRYPVTTIEENIVTVSKGTTPMTHGMNFVSEGIPFLRVQDLVNNPIVPFFASKAIDESTHDFLSRSQLKPDDILISIAGTIGRISIVPKKSPEMNCNQAVAFVRLSETSVLRHCYLMHWLNTRDARLQMAGSAVTATISNLSLGKIRQLIVPVPSLDLQVQFEKICNEFMSMPDHGVKIENLVDSVTTELLTTQ
jgi:type I restriction enzyme, S subunit